MDFELALNFTLKWEGGYRVHRNPGERFITFAGIYEGANPGWEGWKLVKDGKIEEAKPLVREFYYHRYWLPLKCDYMKKKQAVAVFDTAVNLGTRRTAKAVQKLVGVYPDGIIGPVTLKAMKSWKEKDFVREFLKRRIIYYSRLDCERFNIFKKGWINRVFDLMKTLEVAK